MGSASGSKLQPPAKPAKRERETLPSLLNGDSNPNPNPSPSLLLSSPPPPRPLSPSMPMDVDEDHSDAALRRSEFLSREEVLRRRSRRVKRLSKAYSKEYWALMEEVRVKHRDYLWEFGKSPLEEEEDGERGGENGNGDGERKRCAFSGCKSKAMPLTRFCHAHILSDSKQTLYKPCAYVTKSAQNVQITCGKPILRAAVASLCPVHFQKIQRQISQALKKAGLNGSSSSKAAPKFHVMVTESVNQTQSKRRKTH